MVINQTLEVNRKIASQASQGISDEPIYQVFEQIIKELDLKGNLLDFGAGRGNLTKRLQLSERFNSLTAIDLMERPLDTNLAAKWISWDLNEQVHLPDSSFDAIVSAEVIEHLENPRKVVREWFRLLRPGGTLIFSTPNNESWRSLLAFLFQGHFVGFSDSCYPAHITALLRKDIQRILSESGFSEPKFYFTNAGGIPKLPKLKWQNISAGLLKGLRYSDNLIVVTSKSL
jgi:2-polyprenyl-3-methyl-5-hydroxy-6-metoxy-1,4-benzoquinol methylase